MKIAVLGSGNGGCAVAAEWALKGHEVALFDFPQFSKQIKDINKEGGISCEGEIEGFAQIKYAGFDVEKTIKNAEAIFVVGPAYSTKAFGMVVKPCLSKEQLVCICPSSGGGIVNFKLGLEIPLLSDEYMISELSTLPYACRLISDFPATVHIYFKVMGGIYVSALPSKYTSIAYDIIKQVYPVEMTRSVFKTMLQTANNIIHPSITLLNAGRIEDTLGNFLFYKNGATQAVGNLIEALDKEKLALSEALEMDLVPDNEIKVLQGYNLIPSYQEGYRQSPAFSGVKAQTTLDHRYFNEDVGYGLVFMSALAKQINIETPVMDAMILIISKVMKRDYWGEALLTPKILGIENYNRKELINLFNS